MLEKKQTKNLGALPYDTIYDLIKNGHVKNSLNENIKPASLDLSISDEIYKVEGIFQPKPNETVRDVLSQIKKSRHNIKKPLERGSIYVIRLNETLSLPKDIYAFCNPKSTSGRIDAHVRLIADGMSRYDSLRAGFEGEIWISIMPQSFPIQVYQGVCLNQLRFFNADTRISEKELVEMMDKHHLLWRRKDDTPYDYSDIKIRDNDGSLILTIDLESESLGFESISSHAPVDLSKISFYNAKKFFKPVKKRNGYLYLKKDHFYILSTYEAVRVPPELACEMLPMDERSGDFRSHYAGFIDPGWGWGENGEGKGRPLTLEVRPFEDLVVRQGQPIGKIRFEYMTKPPEKAYDSVSSNYVKQSGPKLAKHFK
jgi:dCTP deaminase